MDNTIKIFSNYKLNEIKKFLNPCKFVKIVCYQHKFLNGKTAERVQYRSISMCNDQFYCFIQILSMKLLLSIKFGF